MRSSTPADADGGNRDPRPQKSATGPAWGARTPREATGRGGHRTARRLAANSAWQVASFGCRAVAGLGVMVVLARRGGPTQLGVFQFAVTLTSLLPYYWGFPALLARHVARHPNRARRWIETAMLCTLAIGATFTALFTAGAQIAGPSDRMTALIALGSLAMIFDGIGRLQFALFVAWERMRLETIATAVQEAVFLIGAVGALLAGGGPLEAMAAFVASRGVGAFIAWAIASRLLGGPLVPRSHGVLARRAAKRSAPFAISDTLMLVEMRADAVILGFIKGPGAVGLYQACTSLVLHWNVFARALNHAIYPRMSRAWPKQLEAFGRLRDSSFRALSLVGIPAALGGLMLAPEILRTIYGPRFDEAVLAFRLLVLAIPLRMLANTVSLALVACDRQAVRMHAVAGAAVGNAALNIALIPRWSFVGAAVATVLTEAGLLATYAVLLRRVAGRSRIGRAARLPMMACAPMAGAVLATSQAPLAVPILAGASAYLAALLVAALAGPGGRGRPAAAAVMGLVRPA